MERMVTKKTIKKSKSSSDKDTSSEDDDSVLRGPLILGKIIADSIQKKCEVMYNESHQSDYINYVSRMSHACTHVMS